MANPPITLDSKLVRCQEQISGDVDGRVVMLSIEKGEYYSMNIVGTRVWALLEKPSVVSEMVAGLVDEFEVEPAVCERDVLAFLNRLQKDDLVKTSD